MAAHITLITIALAGLSLLPVRAELVSRSRGARSHQARVEAAVRREPSPV